MRWLNLTISGIFPLETTLPLYISLGFSVLRSIGQNQNMFMQSKWAYETLKRPLFSSRPFSFPLQPLTFSTPWKLTVTFPLPKHADFSDTIKYHPIPIISFNSELSSPIHCVTFSVEDYRRKTNTDSDLVLFTADHRFDALFYLQPPALTWWYVALLGVLVGIYT